MEQQISGQSLVEVLLAVAIGAILIVAAVAVIVPALQENTEAAKIQTASSLGKELLDDVRVWSEGNWNNVLALATGTINTYYLNATSSPFSVVSGSSSSTFNGYSYERSITVSSNASGTQPYFPMLVSSVYSSWEPAPSGNIQHLCTAPNGGQEPCDLIFTSDSGCTSPLNFETESYSSSTGALIDWVNVPSLSTGKTIYACYGNASVIADQSDPHGTWNSNYAAVWHLASPIGAIVMQDSTINANTLQFGSLTHPAVAPELFGGGILDSDYNSWLYTSANLRDSPSASSSWSESAWVYQTSYPSGGQLADAISFGPGGAYNSAGLGEIGASSVAHEYLATYGPDHQTSATVTTNVWHLLTATYDGTNMKMYLDGSFVDSTAYTFSIGAASAFVGTFSGYPSTNGWVGNVVEPRILTTALSPSWILTEYNNQYSPSTFYTVGNQVGGSSGSDAIQSLAVGTSTYTRYFYLSDVQRDDSGNIVTSGGSYDPSTKQATVVYGWSGGPTNTMTTYIVRSQNAAISQNDWSGGPGQNGPETSTNNHFASSSNIDYSTATGAIYVSIPGY